MAGEMWDRLWQRVRVITSDCATNQTLADVRDSLAQGERAVRYAANVSSFARKTAGLEANLRKGADALGEVNGKLEFVNDVCLDVQAVAQIREALIVLNNPNVVIDDPEPATKAFGDLFAGAGRFVGKLPPPVNAYAQILEGCGGLFSGMRRALDPWGGGGVRAQRMQQIFAGERN